MNLKREDWERLRELRSKYLDQDTAEDYWTDKQKLALYDATFAQRIRWKWDFVLKELDELNWTPGANTTLLDYGCGTGIASRSFLKWCRNKNVSIAGVHLRDRSALASEFASEQIKAEFPEIPVTTQNQPRKHTTLLISHLLSELTELDIIKLTQLCKSADDLIVVEPGEKSSSRILSQVRDKIESHQILAPCPFSQRKCGVLLEGMESHWCHFFAKPPDEIFHSREWSRFSDELKIDISSLPVSYLAATREEVHAPDWTRIVGSPRVTKGQVNFWHCTPDSFSEDRIQKRDAPQSYRLAKKGKLPSRLDREAE